MDTPDRAPSFLDAIIPVLVLAALLATSVYLFGDNSSGGANQIALLLAGGVAAVVGLKNGLEWKAIERAITEGISTAMPAILILLAIGSLIGVWILSGTVQTIIYYGLNLLHPDWFYAAVCVICAVVALCIGSSWTTAGTVGVGLMGTALAMGLSPEITAGAVISGAYFGDKMSPLSDTTNLAPGVVGVDLFEHIRHMTWTTGPSLTLAILLFAGLGLSASPDTSTGQVAETQRILVENFDIGVTMLIPLGVILFLAWKKVPAFPAIAVSVLLGALFAVVFQTESILRFVGETGHGRAVSVLQGVWQVMVDGYVASTGDAEIDGLLSRGGMSSMLTTVWLIMCALTFGGIMERTGLLKRIVTTLLGFAHSTKSLIATTAATCIGTNIIASDQYISIVVPGRMFRDEYRNRKLAAKNLSRVLEDTGTITSPLVPWNTCGAFMAATLGVGTLAYLPFCFFNLINPAVSVLYGMYGYKIEPLGAEEAAAVAAEAAAVAAE